MAESITANFHTLMRQASLTAADYMDAAVEQIDRKFGDGFSKRNPALVGAFMNASALDLAAAIIAQQVRDGLEESAYKISLGLSEVAEQIDQLGAALDVAESINSHLSGMSPTSNVGS
jgi:hypothetical protein